MSDLNQGDVPSGHSPGTPSGPPSLAPSPPGDAWPAPVGEASTDRLPSIKDPHPPSRWREVLVVLGIIVSVAVILIAVYPFLADDEGEEQGSPATTTPSTETLPGDTTVAVTPSAETTLDPNATTAPGEVTTLPPGPLAVAVAEATCTAPESTDSRGNTVTFVATNTIDGDPSTAWRCAGNGAGQALTYTLAAPATVTQLGAIPGYAAVDPYNGDDRFVENRRVVSARWSCLAPGGVQTASATQTFADDRQMQTTPVNGFIGCAAIRFEVTGTTPAGRRDFTAVSDVLIGGTT